MQDIFSVVSIVKYLTKVYENMKQRCENPKNPSYHNYGGRGICICGGWEIKENFIRDTFETFPGLGLGYSIERQNVDGNYEPSNCTWATRLEQARNRRNNTKVTFNGEEYSTIAELSENLSQKLNIDVKTISARIYNYDESAHGSDFEAHVTKPVEVSSARIPVTFDGRNFPSKNQAAAATGISRTTVTQRMQRYNVDFDEAARMAPRQNWENPNCSEIVYLGKTYPSHTELGNHLGIAQATITARARKYNPEVHPAWDEYISSPIQIFAKEVTFLDQTFPTIADASKHFGIPSSTLSNWNLTMSPEARDKEIENYGKPKKGIRSVIPYQGVDHTQSSLAKLFGVSQGTLGSWYRKLSSEDFYKKIDSLQKV